MIFQGSRYERVGKYQVTDTGARAISALKIRFVSAVPAGYFHTVTGDERLDLIAYKFYRNPEKFWLIADANNAMDPEDLLEPGDQILIPPDQT